MPEKHVLVIDDEASVRFTVTEALRLAGYEATGAASIAAALHLIHKRVPDLIICDIRIETDDDGFDALATIRRDPRHAAIPFILITGGYDSAVIRRGMESGANDFLVKPFSPRQLVASVDAWLSRPERDAAVSEAIAPHRLLEMVNDVPMLVGTCDPVSTRFEFLNRFGMSMLNVEDAEKVPQIAFSEICEIANSGQNFAETWEATKRDGAWSGNASLRIGETEHANVSLVLTTHSDPGNANHFVTVLARNLTPTTND